MSTVVAAVQFPSQPGAVRLNYNIARQLAFEAALAGARLVVLPELCITSTSIVSIHDAAQGSQSQYGWQTMGMQEISDTTGAYILFGYVEASEGGFFNSACLVGPRGFLHNFRKHNLWSEDFFWATPASNERCETAMTPFGRIGVLICRDVSNRPRKSLGLSDDVRFYDRGSVDIMCVPTSWDTGTGFPNTEWVELSEELSCPVIVSNTAAIAGGDHIGGPCVIDSKRKVWADRSNRTGTCIVGAILHGDNRCQ